MWVVRDFISFCPTFYYFFLRKAYPMAPRARPRKKEKDNGGKGASLWTKRLRHFDVGTKSKEFGRLKFVRPLWDGVTLASSFHIIDIRHIST